MILSSRSPQRARTGTLHRTTQCAVASGSSVEGTSPGADASARIIRTLRARSQPRSPLRFPMGQSPSRGSLARTVPTRSQADCWSCADLSSQQLSVIARPRALSTGWPRARPLCVVRERAQGVRLRALRNAAGFVPPLQTERFKVPLSV
jgi:hypothetical protein